MQLILGGAGSGKTTYLYQKVIKESLEHPDQLYFIIVPEQFTMQTQKDIVTMHPNHGTMNIDIVSFQRLAYRVFEELAVGQLAVLDDIGKSMVLRKVAARCKKQLVLFQGHLGQGGFVSRLKTTISEFYQYGVSPKILREMAPRARSPLLRQKLSEFAVIFQEFQDYIEGHYITTEEVLDVLCRVLPASKLIQTSVVALDGYSGFMPVQFRLLELFMKHSREVLMTVTANRLVTAKQPLGMQDLFAMSSQMVHKLLKLAKENHVEVLPETWLGQNEFHAPELAFLESHLFRYQKAVYDKEPQGGLEFYQAANPSEEVSRVVHHIWRLVKEDGLRFRDIAVVTGDLDGYGREIIHQFEQGRIPSFLDDKRTMLDHPLVELIRAALRAIEQNFSYEAVFRYLRSGLVTGEERMLDRMENYVLAMGIRGSSRWGEQWERTYRGASDLNLKELNTYKDRVMAPLFALLEGFRGEALTVCDMAECVQRLLEDVDAQERIQAFQESFEEQGEYRLAKEYGQIYGMVQELLERLKDLLGDEKAGRREFAEILDAGFAEISVGVIPATVDRVVVGDIMRTRLAHVKVLFFVGVNDGIVPARKEGGSLLTDQEREFLSEHQVELAPTAREDSFQQRFFLYRTMAKPTKTLIISYAGVGADGKSRRASYLIGELRRMFPKAPFTGREAEPSCRQEIYSLEEARQALAVGLQEYSGGDERDGKGYQRFLELYRWFMGSEVYQEEVNQLVDAAFYVYERRGISRAVAQALYGKVISGSVTRLEQYARCAYGHFLKYGLELLERQEYEVRAADIGNLFHDSIDRCFQKVQKEHRDWRTMTDDERQEMVAAVVGQVTAEYGNTIFGSSSRNEFLAGRVEQIAQRTVWALQQQIRRGDFEPVGFELSFSAADNLEAMRIALSEDEELHLRGRIDRLDLCEDEQHIYVKIIDYKSGTTSFDLMALYYGLQLQLVVYMDAVMEMTQRERHDKEVVPAGILYYNIADPVIPGEALAADGGGGYDPGEVEKEVLRRLKMNGLINSELEVIRHMDCSIEKESDIIPVVLKDEAVMEGKSSVASRERFEWLRRFVHEKVRAAGQEILSGEVGAVPYKDSMGTACDFCPYHAVCGFDRKTMGYEYRKLKKKKSEEIWEEICQ